MAKFSAQEYESMKNALGIPDVLVALSRVVRVNAGAASATATVLAQIIL